MSLFEAMVLGVVQGLTEFLPISSTGHLRIVPAFVGWDDPGSAFAAERYGQRRREIASLTTADGVFIGTAQALALVPGVSRSGATISAGLFRGLTREAATRYSFLLSTPAIVLAALLELKGIVDGSEHTGASTADLIVSSVFAFIVGYWSISFLLRFITRHGLVWFVVYRLALGALVLALTAGGAIS